MRNGPMFLEIPPSTPVTGFSDEVLRGLSSKEKSLPSRFFYDEEGSRLFEKITDLPEYYPTRTECAILGLHAGDIVRQADARALIELGSGSSLKTRMLIAAALSLGPASYTPIDISVDFLRESAAALQKDFPNLSVEAIAGEYFDALGSIEPSDANRLFLFLGSNIGNFDPVEADALLRAIRQRMKPSDRLLVGLDLLKDRAIIRAAYNDAAGVTAAFNKNLLGRINRELGGEFDLESFAHEAIFDETRQAIEMRLVSLVDQTVAVKELGRSFSFAKGETIHTEWSHKYSFDAFTERACRSGLRVVESWRDPKDWYALCLLNPI